LNILNWCHGLAPAGNKEPHGRSIAPSPTGVGRRMGKKEAKRMGWDKDGLTEQQRKRTETTIILIRRIYNKTPREYIEQLSLTA